MHPTAMKNCKSFFDNYSKNLESGMVIDIGAQNFNGSLSEVCPKKLTYVGVDFAEGPGVSVVLKDPYSLPFPDNYADMIVSSSCFEHSEMFWLVFLEIMRVLKPSGLFYLNVPSNGPFHRYPVDCWRFYPDSGKALVTWAKHNQLNVCLLESYTSSQEYDGWNDYVAIFLKDEAKAQLHKDRIGDSGSDIENAFSQGVDGLRNYQVYSQDRRIINSLQKKYDVVQMNYNSVKPLAKQWIRVLGRRIKSVISKGNSAQI